MENIKSKLLKYSKNKKIKIILIILTFLFCYQIFLRYEYQLANTDSHTPVVIKIDKLTGQYKRIEQKQTTVFEELINNIKSLTDKNKKYSYDNQKGVYISPKDAKLLIKNGYSHEKIKNMVEVGRKIGFYDHEIQQYIDEEIREIKEKNKTKITKNITNALYSIFAVHIEIIDTNTNDFVKIISSILLTSVLAFVSSVAYFVWWKKSKKFGRKEKWLSLTICGIVYILLSVTLWHLGIIEEKTVPFPLLVAYYYLILYRIS